MWLSQTSGPDCLMVFESGRMARRGFAPAVLACLWLGIWIAETLPATETALALDLLVLAQDNGLQEHTCTPLSRQVSAPP